jgi:dienelactone hydrolase
VLGAGPTAVSGTLSLPHEQGSRPAVVLLAGSGPNDRDETIGRNKPFKDLAWGLATRAVAVLRFEKVTYAHPSEVKQAHDFTVADKYLPHAIAGVQLLQQHPAVEAGGVFVLSHSLGGTIAPRVAADEPSIAGLVIMAGGTTPLHWAAVRQVRYLASLNPQTAAASESVIKAMTEQAELIIDSPRLSPSTPPNDLPFGTPAPYWLHLRGYNPGRDRCKVGEADTHPPRRSGLPGDRVRRSRAVGGRSRSPSRREGDRLRRRQSLLLPRQRPFSTSRIRASTAHGPRRGSRHRPLAGERRRQCRSIRCTGCWLAAVPETHRIRGKLGPPPLPPRERRRGESGFCHAGATGVPPQASGATSARVSENVHW